MPHYKNSPAMFKNNFLDFFSRSPWWLVPLFWLPISILMLYAGIDSARYFNKTIYVLFIVLGWISWTLSEYWLHRILFHWNPRLKWGQQFHFIIHGVHHTWPNDPYRLVMPLLASLILAFIIGGGFYLLLGPYLFFPFFSGYLLGYVQYEMTHYTVHHLKFKNKFFKYLKRHHLLHHHSPDFYNKKYGVSSPFWDYIFRTY